MKTTIFIFSGNAPVVKTSCKWNINLKKQKIRNIMEYKLFFNSFLHIDETDRSKIISDQKRLFIVLSLYPLSFFANTPFNWPELKDLIQLNRGLTFLHLGMLIHITQLFFHLKKQILMNARRQCKITTQLGVFLQYFKLWEFFQKYNIRLQRYNTLYFTYWLYFLVFPSIAV